MTQTLCVYSYLKPKQEYIDRYDEATVSACRAHLAPIEFLLKKHNNARPLRATYFFRKAKITLSWYEKKEKTIKTWMDLDAKKDTVLAQARQPEGIRCLECGSLTEVDDPILFKEDDLDPEHILFFCRCLNGCNSSRAFFNSGKEYYPKSKECPQCLVGEIKLEPKGEGALVHVKETCTNCDYLFEITLGSEDEEIDKDNLRDRDRFCLTDADADEAREALQNIQDLKDFVAEMSLKRNKENINN